MLWQHAQSRAAVGEQLITPLNQGERSACGSIGHLSLSPHGCFLYSPNIEWALFVATPQIFANGDSTELDVSRVA